MKTNIKITVLFLAIASSLMVSCKKEGCTDPKATNYDDKAKKDNNSCKYAKINVNVTNVTVGGVQYKKLSGEVKSNYTMQARYKWLLSGGVFVSNGVTLTIEKGTMIKADDATTAFLSIRQGGKIMAKGTKAEPIVFTTIKSNPTPGSWGGIIVNGRAKINTGSTAQGEGGTGIYGGDKNDDNSGEMTYVRVEYAGKILGVDNELNGFSFNGVGSGTTLHHLQAYRGADDGFEFFGGTVNVRYLISTGNQDDSFDWTHGWSGKGQFLVANQHTDKGDRGIEADKLRDSPAMRQWSVGGVI